MSLRVYIALALFLTACAPTLASLRKPERVEAFTLEKDHVRQEHRGLLNVLWVEGLKAGTYVVAGEDDTGRFFLGEGNAGPIVLSGESAEKYLQSGEIAVSRRGGLWLPNPGVQDEPKIFYELGTGAPSKNVWEELAKNDLLRVGWGSEKDFVASLKIGPR